MFEDLEDAVMRSVGLNRLSADALSISRSRWGRGFRFFQPDGQPISNPNLLDRLRTIGIPPAWTDVKIASDQHGHLQALGWDDAKRRQYVYHEKWSEVRDRVKFERLKRFARCLPRIRQVVDEELRSPSSPENLVAAAAVRLIDRTNIRVGTHSHQRLTGSRGAATLRDSDIEIDGPNIELSFRGKSGVEIEERARDRLLARRLHTFAETGSSTLFDVVVDDERVCLTAERINGFLRNVAGKSVSAKDFRTFEATAVAVHRLAGVDPVGSERARRKILLKVEREVAGLLHNTPAVVRSSYIHPVIPTAWQDGLLTKRLIRGRLRIDLNRAETALSRFLVG